jgi:hypothetical protein
MFGGHPGPWSAAKPWNGSWGDDPPFHHPVFVLTHHPRPPARAEGRDHVHLVTGGASVANQYLSAGLVDEMEIHLVPMLLGGGERLFAGLEDLKGLRPVRTVAAPGVTHLKFSRS